MSGIHHITAIAGKPSRNVDFYTRTLGLRLVKKTVNFDDPTTYHLYYGNKQGEPGTILTFFPWQHAAPGRNGVGLAEETAFRFLQSRSATGHTVFSKRACLTSRSKSALVNWCLRSATRTA